MENVILTIHLILALLLIGVVLLQRSEGGGLGLGGGGGGGVMSGRQAANALSKLTWIFAAAFIATSLGLTIIAAREAATGSVIDQIGAGAPASDTAVELPPAPAIELPPPAATDAPAAPPAAD
ncbi:preprotein translocase subunit SecG [Frigidibacter oleivorans]|uniref:preprotein translocase subunit SecG n=1 Tax=Frigidibacter oleivorans TaxID=2487129 RepID=UPI000F8EDB07|nr:preprotein translocase subunit SecG [Frigidibacter oleivorans]